MDASEPAYVTSGSNARCYIEFVEDTGGDLVDLIYTCVDCVPYESGLMSALHWPAYSDWPDYDVHCGKCEQLINKGRGE